jgi:gas vesicle protein
MSQQRTFYSDEAKQRVRRETTFVLGVVLALGVGIGTAIAMLFAPQSGDETREEIAHATDGTVKKLEKQFNHLREQVEERLTS